MTICNRCGASDSLSKIHVCAQPLTTDTVNICPVCGEQMNLLEFCKNYTTFKPTRFQEILLEQLDSGKEVVIGRRNPSWHRKLVADEFTCSRLLSMKQGESFVLASPDGTRRFVLEEIRPIRSQNDNPD
jgi:hypothetical protein